MKYTKFIALPALNMLLISAAPSIIDINGAYTTSIYGPFTAEDNFNMNIGVRYKLRKLTGYMKLYNHKNGALLSNQEIIFNNGISQDIFVNTKNRLTNNGLGIQINLIGDGTEFFNKYTAIYPPSEREVIAINNYYSYEGVCYGIEDNIVIDKETYDFRESNSLITTNNASELDLSEYCFVYTPRNRVNCLRAYRVITDNAGIYRYTVKISGTNKFIVPLEILEKGGIVSARLKTEMYVNYNTLEMSSLRRIGFELTNSFYIPIGYANDFEKNEIELVIEEAGFNKDKITIPLDYFYSTKHFGSCDDSDICLTGGIKE